MNSLEFIEKEINHWNKVIKHQPSSNDVQKHLNDKLQTLYQIKSELEAWEVAKMKILITDGGVIHMAIEDDDVGYETIIKALEVEE